MKGKLLDINHLHEEFLIFSFIGQTLCDIPRERVSSPQDVHDSLRSVCPFHFNKSAICNFCPSVENVGVCRCVYVLKEAGEGPLLGKVIYSTQSRGGSAFSHTPVHTA